MKGILIIETLEDYEGKREFINSFETIMPLDLLIPMAIKNTLLEDQRNYALSSNISFIERAEDEEIFQEFDSTKEILLNALPMLFQEERKDIVMLQNRVSDKALEELALMASVKDCLTIEKPEYSFSNRALFGKKSKFKRMKR